MLKNYYDFMFCDNVIEFSYIIVIRVFYCQTGITAREMKDKESREC